MFITDMLTITELSRLTKKSRPTLYKYINDFSFGRYDDIPYSIITLFQMSKNCTKEELVSYCQNTYGSNEHGCTKEQTKELVDLILKNENKLDIKKIKEIILKEIENG